MQLVAQAATAAPQPNQAGGPKVREGLRARSPQPPQPPQQPSRPRGFYNRGGRVLAPAAAGGPGPGDGGGDDDGNSSDDGDDDMLDRARAAFGMPLGGNNSSDDDDGDDGEEEDVAMAHAAEEMDLAADDIFHRAMGADNARNAPRGIYRGGQRLGGNNGGEEHGGRGEGHRAGPGAVGGAAQPMTPAQLRALRAQRLAAPAEPAGHVRPAAAAAATPAARFRVAIPTLVSLCVANIGRRLFATEHPILRCVVWLLLGPWGLISLRPFFFGKR